MRTLSIQSKIDKKGRILIPKKLREKLGLKDNSIVKIYSDGSRIIIEPIRRIKKVKARNIEEAFFDAGKATFGD